MANEKKVTESIFEERRPQNLYVRHNNEIKGPFPRGLVRNFVLIGRFKVEDEASGDGESWFEIQSDPSLIPKEMRNLKTKADRERLERAQRRQDERSQDRRTDMSHSDDSERRGQDRRQKEPGEVIEHREHVNKLITNYRDKKQTYLPLVVMGVILAVIFIFTLQIEQQNPASVLQKPDCHSSPAPGVVWRNCSKEGLVAVSVNLKGADMLNADLRGADLHGSNLQFSKLLYANLSMANLSYADLRFAQLYGAGLRNADLTNANLTSANLSYANLKGAKIGGAQLINTRFDRTIWIDGTICKPGSIGVCLK